LWCSEKMKVLKFPCAVLSVISVHFRLSLSRNNGHNSRVLPPTRQNVKLGCWVRQQSSNILGIITKSNVLVIGLFIQNALQVCNKANKYRCPYRAFGRHFWVFLVIVICDVLVKSCQIMLFMSDHGLQVICVIWVKSCHSCQIMLNHVKSCWIMSNHAESCQIMLNHVKSCWIMSNYVESCQIMSSYMSLMFIGHIMCHRRHFQ
jgi:hypothetical protein